MNGAAIIQLALFALVAVGAFFLLRTVMRHNGDIASLKGDVAKLTGQLPKL